MKTAVILSGQTRTFARCLPSLHWAVFSKLENPHFFASVANDEDAGAIELLRQQYPDAPVFIEKVDQPTLPEPPVQTSWHAPYAITPTKTPGVGPLQGILRALWHYSRAWKFACEHGAQECDVVVRCRPDLHFHGFAWNFGAPEAHVAVTPWWGRYGGCNDRFGVMGHTAAKAYFETYDVLPEMINDGIPFHPETLVHTALCRAGCSVRHTLAAEFAMLRKNGELVHMQVLPGELAEWIAHLSKR